MKIRAACAYHIVTAFLRQMTTLTGRICCCFGPEIARVISLWTRHWSKRSSDEEFYFFQELGIVQEAHRAAKKIPAASFSFACASASWQSRLSLWPGQMRCLQLEEKGAHHCQTPLLALKWNHLELSHYSWKRCQHSWGYRECLDIQKASTLFQLSSKNV